MNDDEVAEYLRAKGWAVTRPGLLSLEWIGQRAPDWVRRLPRADLGIAQCGCRLQLVTYIPAADVALHWDGTVCASPFLSHRVAEDVGAVGSRFAQSFRTTEDERLSA
jgi:hypothetical protein